MNCTVTLPLSSRCSLARNFSAANRSTRQSIVASATLSATKPSGSAEHGRGHSDFESAQPRAGVCSITFETTSGAHVIKAQKGEGTTFATDSRLSSSLPIYSPSSAQHANTFPLISLVGANVYHTADNAGLHLPASCKQGSCSSCVGKVLEGRVTHSHDPQCLTPSLKAQGYVALCCASVVGDATILTHQGAKLRAARALQLDRMRHKHG